MAVDIVEDSPPVGALEAGEAQGLVEAAIVADREVGAEDDANPSAGVRQARRLCRRPGLAQQEKARRIERSRRASKRGRDRSEQECAAKHGLWMSNVRAWFSELRGCGLPCHRST